MMILLWSFASYHNIIDLYVTWDKITSKTNTFHGALQNQVLRTPLWLNNFDGSFVMQIYKQLHIWYKK